LVSVLAKTITTTARNLPAQHIIPVDQSIPGANQAQNRTAIHLHGGLVPWISDGGPFDWWAPNGSHGLGFLNGPQGVLDNIPGKPMQPGQADYYYPNNQSCRLLWYHDHAWGITRLSAYAGIATGYLLLDDINEGYIKAGVIPGLQSTIPLIFEDKVFVSPTTRITDPTWATVARPDCQAQGSLWYEHVYNPADIEQPPPGPPPANPSCVPEFFGDTMLCNGTAYPLLTVEAKRYRFLMLNACNARFLNLNLFEVPPNSVEGLNFDLKSLFPKFNLPGPDMIQIGTEGGFLRKEVVFHNAHPLNPVALTGNLLLGNAERADVIIDFTGKSGKHYILYNDAPAPFPGGGSDTDYYLFNPDYPGRTKPGCGPDTRQILRIKVVPAKTPDPQPARPILVPQALDPASLADYSHLDSLPPGRAIPPLEPAVTVDLVRQLTLNEGFDANGRLIQKLGTTALYPGNPDLGMEYMQPATEVVDKGSVEVWQIWNLTGDTHPIHFHLVNVQVLSRQPFSGDGITTPLAVSGPARGPELNELGWKETVKMHPGEVISVIMKFDLPTSPFDIPSSPRAPYMGPATADPTKKYHEYVWHCHILEHEEHDMMRPMVVKE
jgi:spore coat protein A, manganese oxidase